MLHRNHMLLKAYVSSHRLPSIANDDTLINQYFSRGQNAKNCSTNGLN